MTKELKYSIEASVNIALTETQKNKLTLALGNALKEVIGDPVSGTITIYSEKVTEGYVIECKGHGFLTQDLCWYGTSLEKAWVHSKTILKVLKKRYWKWELRPTRVYPAIYDLETKTTKITGKLFDFHSYLLRDDED